jgi:hypothetical protein
MGCYVPAHVPACANPRPTFGVAGTNATSGEKSNHAISMIEPDAALLAILCRPLPIDLPTTSNPAQLHWRQVNRTIRAERQRAAGQQGERTESVDSINELGVSDAV